MLCLCTKPDGTRFEKIDPGSIEFIMVDTEYSHVILSMPSHKTIRVYPAHGQQVWTLFDTIFNAWVSGGSKHATQ